jgi:pyridoxine kinase
MFNGFTFCDLTKEITPIGAHWKKEGLKFDTIYTGYLGSFEQLQLVSDLIKDFKTADNMVFIDPVMADNGKLYPGFGDDFPAKMAKLCKGADYLLPNLTEAAFLLGEECRLENYDQAYIEDTVRKLHTLGAKNVILTGVSFEPGLLGCAVSDGTAIEYDFNPRLARSSHGTGDLFASVFTGALMRGKSPLEASAIAADVVCMAIPATPDEHWYGVCFEKVIPGLVELLK